MQTSYLTKESLLIGYDAVSALYPNIPSLLHWRAWEYAAYQHFQLSGRVLDLGCGNGQYFQLLWPKIRTVTGLDMDPVAVQAGELSGVYQTVHCGLAHAIPEPDESFDCVFANCSLEHMDCLADVLREVYRCLRPGGTLLCSVVTNRFVEWALLQNLVAIAGYKDVSKSLLNDFLEYHHLANPLTIEDWVKSFEEAGFVAKSHIPILPKYNTGIFLLMDSIWHVKKAGGGEMGDLIHPFLSSNPGFSAGFKKVFSGLLDMEMDWQDCSGAVFMLKKMG